MSAAILTTTPSPLSPVSQPYSAGREKKFSPTPTIMFWLLSCKERVYDDISEPDFSRKSLKYLDKFYKRHQDKALFGEGLGQIFFGY
ncbi:hypothetical protein OROMI_004466 [Orobanche minor]